MSEWDRLVEKLRHPENPVVFFDVAAGGAPIGFFEKNFFEH